jgi:hypothetical protein
MSKPREFWYNKYTCEVHLSQLSDDDVHVIEYEACAELKAKNRKLRESLRIIEEKLFESFDDRDELEAQLRIFVDSSQVRERAKLEADRAVLVEALNSIIAKSHSWLITRETGMIQKPIHDSYRLISHDALKKIGEVTNG